MSEQNLEHRLHAEEADGLPFMFSFGQEVDGDVSPREAGFETEFWTHPYEVPDTD